ncbi:hypothetical protein [Kribbella lupini]|uniref:Uncharacterized protein n=1 Tax=Kribbella lupini TaxID=291602 RepID=A0ABN2CUK4_9ACTN
MTDLRNLLDQAAGPAPTLTDDQLSTAIARGRHSRRRRGLTVAVASVAVVVAAGGVALALPSAGEAPAAAGSGPSAGPVTCGQLFADNTIERTRYEMKPGEQNADGVRLRLGGFPEQTQPAQDGEPVPAMSFAWPLANPRVFTPAALVDVPPPAGQGWPNEVWTKVVSACYPVR